MAEGGGPGDVRQGKLSGMADYRRNPKFQRAMNVSMRVLGLYLLVRGGRAAITRRSLAGAAVALGGLQLLSGRNPTYGNPVLTTAISRIRRQPSA